jgi:hypothetical protein
MGESYRHTTWNVGDVLKWGLLFLIVGIFLIFGGGFTIARIGYLSTQVPLFLWVLLGLLILIKFIGGKK